MNLELEAQAFGVIRTRTRCDACRSDTPVSGIVLFGYRSRMSPDVEWVPHLDTALLSHVQQLDAGARSAWFAFAPNVSLHSFRVLGTPYLVNQCAHCTTAVGDSAIRQVGGPFNLTHPRHLASMRLNWLDIPLRATARTALTEAVEHLVSRVPPFRPG